MEFGSYHISDVPQGSDQERYCTDDDDNQWNRETVEEDVNIARNALVRREYTQNNTSAEVHCNDNGNNGKSESSDD